LCSDYPQEHRQRIYCGVAYCRNIISGKCICKRKSRRVGHTTRYKSHQRIIIQLANLTSDNSHCKNWYNSNYNTITNPFVSTAYNSLNETATRFQSHTREEQSNTYLSEHQVCTHGSISNKFKFGAKFTDKNSNDKWTTCKSKFHRLRYTREHDWNTSYKNTKRDTNED